MLNSINKWCRRWLVKHSFNESQSFWCHLCYIKFTSIRRLTVFFWDCHILKINSSYVPCWMKASSWDFVRNGPSLMSWLMKQTGNFWWSQIHGNISIRLPSSLLYINEVKQLFMLYFHINLLSGNKGHIW